MSRRWKKLFGIGLSRTGTTSLNEAFEVLGYRSIHWPKHLAEIAKYDAATDQTVGIAYQELDVQFPGSGFVLTVRQMDEWLGSMKWMMNRLHLAPHDLYEFMIKTRRRIYNTPVYDERLLREAHEKHIKEVMNYFSIDSSRLLVMNVCAGDGWGKLAPFVGVPIPAKPFPRSNERTA